MTSIRVVKRVLTAASQKVHPSRAKNAYNARQPQAVFMGMQQWVETNVDRTDQRRNGAINAVRLPSDVHPDIQRALKRAKTAKDVIQIIDQNRGIITDCSLHSKAMQICDKQFRDPESAHQVMQLLLSSSVASPDSIAFNTIINIMARFDFPNRAVQLFHAMITKYDIKPDDVTFGTLLKAFKQQCQWTEAIHVLELMRNKFRISPSEFHYAELLGIAARAHKTEEGHALFREYLHKVKSGELTLNLPVLCAYLHIFSKCGHVTGMQMAKKLIHEFGFSLNEVIVGDMMLGYVTAREPEKCHQILSEWIEKHAGKVNDIMLAMRCVAFVQQIQNATKFKKKLKLYRELENAVFRESEKHGININSVHTNTLLTGCIDIYGSRDPIKIVALFEKLVQEKCIVYTKQETIDLHRFEPMIAQFVIRYVFAFKLKQHMKSKQDDLIMIVGKGKHRAGDGNHKANLQRFVMQELLSWTPPLRTKTLPNNAGRIAVEYKELEHYLENEENNFAKQKLTIPSADWYTEDRGQ